MFAIKSLTLRKINSVTPLKPRDVKGDRIHIMAVTLDYLRKLKIIADWCYDGEEDELNSEFFTLDEVFTDDRILEFIKPEEVNLDDEYGLGDFEMNITDLLQSEWGENSEIKTLCVKDPTGKVLKEI